MNVESALTVVARRAGVLLAVVSLALIAIAGRAHASGVDDDGEDELAGLSLVYLDTSRGVSVDLWVADARGEEPRLVAELPLGSRPLALSGALAAFAAGQRLVTVDLRTGERFEAEMPGPVRSGVFFFDGLMLVSTMGAGTCAPDPLALPQPSRLVRVNVYTGEAEVIAVAANRLLDVLDAGAETNEAVVLPRGCDVGIGELRVYDIVTGDVLRTASVRGCGWAAVSPGDAARALVGWQSCTVPDAHAGAVATLYDLATGEGTDILAVTNATARGPFLFTPDGAQVAAGGFFGGIAGPRGSTTGAVWLVNPTTFELSLLAQGLGVEASPVGWSPTGRYLLVQAVEAQGRCAYHIVEPVSGAVHPISPAITVCGANGDVLGWTALA